MKLKLLGRRLVWRGVTAASFSLLLAWASLAEAQETYWPAGEWRTSTPEAQGMDSAILLKAFDYVREHRTRIHSLMIVRNGHVVVDAYFYPFMRGERHDLASATKSVTTTLIGVAIGDGLIRDVDQPVLSFFPETGPQYRDARKDDVTLTHLLTMTSGFDCQFRPAEPTLREMRLSPNWVQFMLERPMISDPGTSYVYCSPGMHLLSGVVGRVTGQPSLAYARGRLFAPLGVRNVAWPADSQSVSHGWGDLELEPRDMAKIGYLWLQGGRWDGRQIVPADYMRAAAQTQARPNADEGYGYGLWIHPDTAGGYFEANGRGGQRIVVLPKWNMVLAITGAGFEPGDIAGFLFDAVKSDTPLPENPQAARRLRAAVAAVAKAPSAGVPTVRATGAGAQSAVLRRIAGRHYQVERNGWGLASFSVGRTGLSSLWLDLVFSDGHVERLKLNMDGVAGLQKVGEHRALVSSMLEGGETLVVNYNQIARINDVELRFRFTEEQATVQLLERSEQARFEIVGRWQDQP